MVKHKKTNNNKSDNGQHTEKNSDKMKIALKFAVRRCIYEIKCNSQLCLGWPPIRYWNSSKRLLYQMAMIEIVDIKTLLNENCISSAINSLLYK